MRIEITVSDTELVTRTLQGERSAFALLMARHRPQALRLARSLTRNDEAAREAVQEAALRAYLSLSRLREPAQFCDWLRGIVRNVCRERLPLFVLWDDPENEFLLPPAPDTARLASQRADDRAVREAVALLSPALRSAVQRFYFEGWSIEETAAQLGISVGAVKVRLHDARRRLKPLIETRFPERVFPALPSKTRRKIMSVPVHLVDLPPLTAITHPPVDSLATAQLFLMKMAVPPQGQRRALLANATGDRFLPLLIESIDFGMALSMKNFDRFGLLDLTLRLLDVTGGVIENIEIQSLDAGVLVASLTVKSGEQKVTVEARPTDALALAVKQEIPLSLASPLMERDGWKIPDAEHIFARILARDVDEPYLIRVVDMLLQEAARWHESTDKWQLVPRDGMVWNSMQIIDKRDNSTMVKANAFPTYIPPDAFPAIVARLKHVGGLDLSVTDRERIGETTVDFAGKPVRLQIKTTPGAQGETLSLHCVPQPPEESDSPMERNSPASCVK